MSKMKYHHQPSASITYLYTGPADCDICGHEWIGTFPQKVAPLVINGTLTPQDLDEQQCENCGEYGGVTLV